MPAGQKKTGAAAIHAGREGRGFLCGLFFRDRLAGARRLDEWHFSYHALRDHVPQRATPPQKNERITWRGAAAADVKVRRAGVKRVVFADKVTARAQNLSTAVA